MKKPITNILLFAILYMTAASASAALVTSLPLNGVTILGHVYNVTFRADNREVTGPGTDYQSYNSLGGPEVPVFDSIHKAEAAITAITASAPAGFSYNVGAQNIFGAANGYRVAYLVEAATYNYLTYLPGSGTFGGFTDISRSVDNILSLATFELAEVPVPAAVWLFGSVLLGFGFFRKKGKLTA